MSSPFEPRLAPLPFAEWDDHTRTILLRYLRRPEVYLSGEPDAPQMPIVLELMARQVPLSEPWLRLTDALTGEDARLPAEHRELLILRVAWRSGSLYEWDQHRRISLDVGISPQALDAVPEGPSAEAWTPVQRSLVKAADEMLDGFSVADETWSELQGHYDSGQLLELLYVVATYAGLAMVLNSAGLPSAGPGGSAPRRRD